MQRTATRYGILLSLVFILLIPAPYLSPIFERQTARFVVHYASDPSMPMPSIQDAIPISSTQLAPVTGVLKVLIIAATFSDLNNTEAVGDTKQAFFGTVNNYYKEVSYGAVSLEGDVVGWYRLSNTKDYYGRDCMGIDDTDCSGQPSSWYFARDALIAAQNDVNLQDYNYFVFVHSGYGEESSRVNDDLWSVTYLGGVWITSKTGSINKFAILPELQAGAVPIGVYAHEFAHLLGLPDLYNTNTGRTVMGPWSLMDKGLWGGNPPGSTPSHIEAWSKIKLGWINGSLLGIASPGMVSNFTIVPTEESSGEVHVVKVPVSTSSPASQYYLVEVRERIGFDSNLPAAGVLITSVNERAFVNSVTVINAHPNVPGLSEATWSVGQTFSDDRNNIAIAVIAQVGNSYQIIVNRLGPMPDLSVTRIFTQPDTITPNATVTIFIAIANQGTLAASNVPVQVTLDGQLFANMQVAVAAKSTSELELTWKAIAGNHQFRVAIDPTDGLKELNKMNNVGTLNLSVGPVLIITVPLDISTSNTTTWVSVNGVRYYANGSEQVKASVAPGTVTVEIASTIDTSPGTRRVFAGWSDGEVTNPRHVTVNSNMTLNAMFKTQFQLTIDPNGGVTTQGGWFDQNTTLMIAATSPSNVTQQVSRIVFTRWSGGIDSAASSISVKMIRPISVKANWKTQYYLSVASPVGSPSGSGWYDAGSTATISVQPTVELENKTRAVFTGWNGTTPSPSGTVVMNVPTLVVAQWKPQYMIQINSPYGNPQGAGWYDAGAVAQVSIRPQVDQGNRTRRIFDEWSGDYSGSNTTLALKVDSPKSLTAKWTTQYLLVFAVSGIPNSTSVDLKMNGEYQEISINKEYREWFGQGQRIDATTNQTFLADFVIYKFVHWQNSTGATVTTPITVVGPQDYTAVYTSAVSLPAIPGFPWESILAGMVLGLLSLTFARRANRRTRSSMHQAVPLTC